MNYDLFSSILTKKIFEEEKIDILKRIAKSPERFIVLFRPTKPKAKILQYLLQSREIKMGDALEEVIEKILVSFNFKILPKRVQTQNGDVLSLDHYFTDENENLYYFIEQKIRDDHDSTKKRGQIDNFERKAALLYDKHGEKLHSIIYFLDPDLEKNKRYYTEELDRLGKRYGCKFHIFYGKEFFSYLKHPEMWDNLIDWLKRWKDSLPDLPEINFDTDPHTTFNEIKELESFYWRRIFENEKLWKDGIIQAIFRNGNALKLLLKFFMEKEKESDPYGHLAKLLEDKLNTYYKR